MGYTFTIPQVKKMLKTGYYSRNIFGGRKIPKSEIKHLKQHLKMRLAHRGKQKRKKSLNLSIYKKIGLI